VFIGCKGKDYMGVCGHWKSEELREGARAFGRTTLRVLLYEHAIAFEASLLVVDA
jgi:hypothetical protein